MDARQAKPNTRAVCLCSSVGAGGAWPVLTKSAASPGRTSNGVTLHQLLHAVIGPKQNAPYTAWRAAEMPHRHRMSLRASRIDDNKINL